MYATAQTIHPVDTVFGAAFIAEQHVEGDQRKLAAVEDERRFADFVRSLRGLISGEAGRHQQAIS